MKQAIQTKYLGPTNHRGARIKVWCGAGTKYVAWDYAMGVEDNHIWAAGLLIEELGWQQDNRVIAGSLNNGYVFVLVNRHMPEGKIK